ncbi:sensor histidine kinase [Nafulsella turpanensis]|uniref:sensor histidine kinase n=1 Tax=Nafulsella turpanensis TaxID=1265690 RepID=UPI000347FDA3|nr:ATP-binding protein [Nafulsella turpanensis]
MEEKAEVKILLVDDREENILALETILETEGYKFVKARSGREALKCLLDDHDFYLIIMDVIMPGMNGFETAELIYSREKLKNIPIIFLTAIDIEENMYKGYKAGAVDYINKPFVPELLRAKVGAFVELSIKNKKLLSQEEKLRTINKNLEREIAERKASEEKVRQLNKHLEEKLEELQSLDAFAYSVSHDLMSPVNNISGLTSLLMKRYGDQFDGNVSKVLNLVMDSTQKMSEMIRSMLLFSRQANAELIKTEVDMNKIVHAVIDDIGTYKTIDHFRIKIDKLPLIEGDSNMLKQVWVNFISNAIKYSQKEEQPVIEVGASEENEDVVFYVKDNGAGFDMKNYDKLFGVFQRLHSAKDFEGTGVGLAIVKRIVERHGGKVWAESVLGKGSTFFFSLKPAHRRIPVKSLVK